MKLKKLLKKLKNFNEKNIKLYISYQGGEYSYCVNVDDLFRGYPRDHDKYCLLNTKIVYYELHSNYQFNCVDMHVKLKRRNTKEEENE